MFIKGMSFTIEKESTDICNFYSKSTKGIHFKAIAYRQPYLYTCTNFWKRQRTHYTLILENFGNKKIVHQ